MENAMEESLPKNPNLELAQALFVLTTQKEKRDQTLIDMLTTEIRNNKMAPFYEEVSKKMLLNANSICILQTIHLNRCAKR